MIILNLQNGVLKVDNLTLSSDTQIDYLDKIGDSICIEKWITNGSYNSYKLVLGHIILILFFQNEQLKVIEIFPKSTIEEYRLNQIINSLGGEQSYIWGTVELNIDKKANYESIHINYKFLR